VDDKGIILVKETTGYVDGVKKGSCNCVIMDTKELSLGYDIGRLVKSIRRASKPESWAVVVCDMKKIKKEKGEVHWWPMDVVIEFQKKNWNLFGSIAVASKMPKRRIGKFGSSLMFMFVFRYSSDSVFMDEYDDPCSDFLCSEVLAGSDKFESTIPPGVIQEVLKSFVPDRGSILILNPRDSNFLLACKNSGIDYTVVTESEKMYDKLLYASRQMTVDEGISHRKEQMNL